MIQYLEWVELVAFSVICAAIMIIALKHMIEIKKTEETNEKIKLSPNRVIFCTALMFLLSNLISIVPLPSSVSLMIKQSCYILGLFGMVMKFIDQAKETHKKLHMIFGQSITNKKNTFLELLSYGAIICSLVLIGFQKTQTALIVMLSMCIVMPIYYAYIRYVAAQGFHKGYGGNLTWQNFMAFYTPIITSSIIGLIGMASMACMIFDFAAPLLKAMLPSLMGAVMVDMIFSLLHEFKPKPPRFKNDDSDYNEPDEESMLESKNPQENLENALNSQIKESETEKSQIKNFSQKETLQEIENQLMNQQSALGDHKNDLDQKDINELERSKKND